MCGLCGWCRTSGIFHCKGVEGANHVIYHAILPIFPLCALSLFHLFFSCIGLDLSSVKRPKQKEVRKCNCFEIALSVKMTVFLINTDRLSFPSLIPLPFLLSTLPPSTTHPFPRPNSLAFMYHMGHMGHMGLTCEA